MMRAKPLLWNVRDGKNSVLRFRQSFPYPRFLSISLSRFFHSQCCSKEVCKVSLYLYLLGGIYLCLCMWKIGYNHWLHVWTQTDNAFKRIRILSKYDIYAGIVLYLIRLWLTEMHLMMPSVGMWLCQWKGGARTQPNNRCTKTYML